MSTDHWIIVSSIGTAISAVATIIYVIVTRAIAQATNKQADISASIAQITNRQIALQEKQFVLAENEKIMACYYTTYDLWRFTALVHEKVINKVKPSTEKHVLEFFRLYIPFMAQHYPVFVARFGSDSEECMGLMYIDNIVTTAKESDIWMGYPDFMERWGNLFEFFNKLKGKLLDKLQ